MPKIVYKSVIAAVLVVFLPILAIQTADADGTCGTGNYFERIDCSSPNFDSSKITTTYGDPTGAVEPVTKACYRMRWNNNTPNDNTDDTYERNAIVYIFTKCDTSYGYVDEPSSSSTTMCLVPYPSASPSNVSYSTCTCRNSGYTAWTDVSGQNYQSSEYINCPNATTTLYRCKTGYYSATGTSTASVPSALNCTQCPNNSTTENAGATSISECCYTADTPPISKPAGTFKYTDGCCYDNW